MIVTVIIKPIMGRLGQLTSPKHNYSIKSAELMGALMGTGDE